MTTPSSAILKWYNKYKRDLPWRNSKDPYKIWLSEIILQQTRVNQGLPYYNKFVEVFPNIKSMANATEEKILKLWQGLGYYSRARHLHQTAKIILHNYNGSFPDSYDQIRKLKGIGPYTAAAIASFAFNLPHAVVDGNVYRVLSRYFGIKTPINSTKGKKEFENLANKILIKKKAGIFNQAIMEFGAMHCKPVNPLCHCCPLSHNCFSHKNNHTKKLPVKLKKISKRNRYFNYFVLKNRNTIIIQKRKNNDIWKNLFEFPLVETINEISNKKVFKSNEWKSIIGSSKYSIIRKSETFKHTLSHQTLYAVFWDIELEDAIYRKKESLFVKIKDISTIAVPRLIHRYLENTLFIN